MSTWQRSAHSRGVGATCLLPRVAPVHLSHPHDLEAPARTGQRVELPSEVGEDWMPPRRQVGPIDELRVPCADIVSVRSKQEGHRRVLGSVAHCRAVCVLQLAPRRD
eukprot:3864991-Prymnesium_polylepis.1